jgi:hypothetical protein
MSQEIEIQTIKPHSAKQELIMRAFQYKQVREVFVACGSKFGKSLAASTALTHGIFNNPGGTWRWIAPIYRQSKIGMSYFKYIAPPEPHSRIIESKMVMEFPGLDSTLEFWHTQRPVDLEGAGIKGQVGDEAAKMPYEAYISANTTTTFTQGLSMWISTPWGKNWFYKKYMEAREHMAWSLANGKIPERIAIHAPTSANPLLPPKVMQLAKLRLSERMYRQYHLAEFLDDGSVFINFRKCVRGTELDFDFSPTQRWFADKDEFEKKGVIDKDVVIGVDWAKHRDYTVITVIDPIANPRRVVGFMRFQGMKYTDQIKELYLICKMYRNVGMILHDKTGVGVAIDDMLSPLPFPFEGVTFTNALKSELVNNLGMTFEKESVELPNWPEMLKELDSFEVVINKLGTTIYNAPDGSHDDIVISLALALRAASEYAGDFEVRYLEDLDGIEMPLDKYYLDMIEDDF